MLVQRSAVCVTRESLLRLETPRVICVRLATSAFLDSLNALNVTGENLRTTLEAVHVPSAALDMQLIYLVLFPAHHALLAFINKAQVPDYAIDVQKQNMQVKLLLSCVPNAAMV